MWPAMGLADAFVTGGGYKYCQLGEGNAFLRVPPGRQMRPVLTGWFAEFASRGDRSDRARFTTEAEPTRLREPPTIRRRTIELRPSSGSTRGRS